MLSLRVCAYHLRILVFVGISFHIPDDLVCEQLRDFACLYDIPLDISERIVSQCLYDLRHVEESDIYGMVLESAHCVLDDVRMISVCR